MRLEAVQSHALSRSIALPRGPEALCRELRNALRAASDEGVLLTSPHEIFQRVRTLSGPPRNLAEQLRERRLLDRAYCIVGGEKNQDRDRAVSHLLRDDGAWFDFSITVRESAGNLELLAYDFEIRFPAAMGASFLRFDLNLPAHRNEDRELRSHLHVGSDDMYVPAPIDDSAGARRVVRL